MMVRLHRALPAHHLWLGVDRPIGAVVRVSVAGDIAGNVADFMSDVLP